MVAGKKHGKTFRFDNVFSQYATQAEVYNEAVLPVVKEVLQVSFVLDMSHTYFLLLYRFPVFSFLSYVLFCMSLFECG